MKVEITLKRKTQKPTGQNQSFVVKLLVTLQGAFSQQLKTLTLSVVYAAGGAEAKATAVLFI